MINNTRDIIHELGFIKSLTNYRIKSYNKKYFEMHKKYVRLNFFLRRHLAITNKAEKNKNKPYYASILLFLSIFGAALLETPVYFLPFLLIEIGCLIGAIYLDFIPKDRSFSDSSAYDIYRAKRIYHEYGRVDNGVSDHYYNMSLLGDILKSAFPKIDVDRILPVWNDDEIYYFIGDDEAIKEFNDILNGIKRFDGTRLLYGVHSTCFTDRTFGVNCIAEKCNSLNYAKGFEKPVDYYLAQFSEAKKNEADRKIEYLASNHREAERARIERDKQIEYEKAQEKKALETERLIDDLKEYIRNNK